MRGLKKLLILFFLWVKVIWLTGKEMRPVWAMPQVWAAKDERFLNNGVAAKGRRPQQIIYDRKKYR